MDIDFIAHPTATTRLGQFLVDELRSEDWKEFRAAVAFVKRSGTKHIREALRAFSESGRDVRISAGIDGRCTSAEGLLDLVQAVDGRGQIYVFKNANSSTFHPKVYLFTNENEAALVVGSGNLTEGGLFTNYEASVLLHLNRSDSEHAKLLAAVEGILDQWSTATEGLCYLLDAALIDTLKEQGHVPDEANARTIDETSKSAAEDGDAPYLFHRVSVPGAPKIPKATAPPAIAPPSPAPAKEAVHRIFLMTVQTTDVGVGQTTAGTSRRSPEIFIPLAARDFDQKFWGWPDEFVTDHHYKGPVDGQGRGKMDRPNVVIRLGGDTFPVSIWYNPNKRDVRIRSEHLRRAGNVGDILYMEKSDAGAVYEYYVDIVPKGSTKYTSLNSSCNKQVRNSKKRWGYL